MLDWFQRHSCSHDYGTFFDYHGHCPPSAAAYTPWWGWVLYVLLLLAIFAFVASFFRVIQAYEKGVVLRLGRYTRTSEPGLRFVFWLFGERLYRVSMQIETVELERQQVITKDSVSLDILGVVYYKVTKAEDSVIKIDDVEDAISRLAPAIMRRIIGQHSLDEVLSHSQNVDDAIKSELEQGTDDWGVRIDRIELQDVKLPESMARSMAAKAESTREAEAKVIAAQGELDASELLKRASSNLDATALELRRLQTWREIGTDNATIIVVAKDGDGDAAGSAAAGALAASHSNGSSE